LVRHAFERLGIDDDVLVSGFFRTDEPLDFFYDVGRGLDVSTIPWAALLISTGSNFSSCTCAGISECGWRKSFLSGMFAGVSGFFRALRRQTCGDVFRRSISLCSVCQIRARCRLFARLRTRLSRSRSALRILPEAAFGLKRIHGVAGKIIVVIFNTSSMDVDVLHQPAINEHNTDDRVLNSGSGMPVTGTMRMFHAI